MPPAQWSRHPSVSGTLVSLSLWCCASTTVVTTSLSATETFWAHPQHPSLLEATSSPWYTNDTSFSKAFMFICEMRLCGSTSQMTVMFSPTNPEWGLWQGNFVLMCTWCSLLTIRQMKWSPQPSDEPLTCSCLQLFKCFFKVNGDLGCRVIHCWWYTFYWTSRVLMHKCTTRGKNAAFETFQFLSSFIHLKSGQIKSTSWNRSSSKEGHNYFGDITQWMALIYQNYLHGTINSRLHSGNVCHCSGHNLMSPSSHSKNMKIKIHNHTFACSFVWV